MFASASRGTARISSRCSAVSSQCRTFSTDCYGGMSIEHNKPDQFARPAALEGETDVFRRLVAALEKADVEFLHTHHHAVFTSSEAASARGTSLHSGAKALILKGGEDFSMAVMPADMSLDSNAFRKLLGCKRLRFATKDEVFALTAPSPGSSCR